MGLTPTDPYQPAPPPPAPAGETPDPSDATLRALAYDKALTAVMPADFKDWHQNSRSEWPAVAAWVIRNLRERLDAADAENARLTAAKTAPSDDTLRARALNCAEQLEYVLEDVVDREEGHDKTVAIILAALQRAREGK